MRAGWGLFLLLFLTAGVHAQTFSFPVPNIPVPGLTPTSSTSASSSTAPSPVVPVAIPVAHAPVMFNNQPLFQVYGPNVRVAQDRADLATLRLADELNALPRDAVAEPPQVTVDTSKSTDNSTAETVLRLGGQPLLTVTLADTDNTKEDAATLANVWATQINKAFVQALHERTPGYLRSAAIKAVFLALTGVILQLLIWFLAVRLRGAPGWPVQVLLWEILVRWVLYLFPQTRPFDAWLMFGPAKPVTVLVDVGLLAAVMARLWGSILRRLFPPMTEKISHEEWGRRTFLRRATLASIARVTGVTLIWIVATISALGWAGVNLSALLTSAGLIGVGIGLATQDMMKDLVAGINILADDRFGVGDTIQMGEYEGRVEKLDLRITQIRDLSGRLITIPNRNIAQVANLTSRWAQVDLRIGVSYYDDLRRAMDLMVATAKKLREDWKGRILADPDMLGVDSFNDANITLRMLVRTPPGDQWHVARELRTRIKEAFDEAGIAFTNALHTAPPPSDDEPEPTDAPEPGRNGHDHQEDAAQTHDAQGTDAVPEEHASEK